MKYIQKQQEPQSFTDWKNRANADWQPTYDTLRGAVKNDVKTALLIEQGHLCCYCESSLTDEDSHIEHFRPQHDQAIDPIDFSNLLCSCQKYLQKGEPLHCGNLKGCWFDENLLISPLELTCETRFAFTADGHIKPNQAIDAAALKTIEKLGLDIPKLRALRANAIAPFLEDSLSEEELKRFVEGYLEFSENGNQLSAFWTTIHNIFQPHIGRVIN
ncbi:TIGR02646 family protein [Leptolyngbya cf. ectocarpi LEGE 11479]|uniref:TIGR02646 family protein n=1 Tax=Leptolyngbya cf. ectocarpi LEGE 11479 TaxID=1828722 RepID=A0A929FD21_LEPEC|nr:retron system putative HNH endonuclease [Leptolyngbya ectocarpi]MBE9070599.1 TIGR02646 family protein [Leptolyngbya cf. ectocarpi LEGE 11479]